MSFLSWNINSPKKPVFEIDNDLLIMNVKKYNPGICWFVNVGLCFTESGSG